MKKLIFSIIFLIGLVGFAQTNPVNTSIDTTNIRIGERLLYKITVDGINEIVFPKLQNIGKVEVVEEFKTDTLKNKLIHKYHLTSFDSGQFIIPKQQVLINNKIFYTDSLLVNVTTVAVDTTKQKMFTIKPIVEEPYIFDDFKPYLWWLLFLLAVIAAGIFYYLRKKNIVIFERKPSIPPFDEALQKLKLLDKKQLWQHQKTKEYYIELTEIVRAYIEKEWRIPALESTTDELHGFMLDFIEIKKLPTNKQTAMRLHKLLQEADLVKFAKYTPVSSEIEMHRNEAEQLITALKPKTEKTDEVV
ncbi:MAG: cbb3-type cytochrome c oxidase subunit 3 [Flavobacteriaceae bacterium]|nr:cbb3-type cytochrome c oxidase subunit 3 [Flavobacteriaceae bacterium]